MTVLRQSEKDLQSALVQRLALDLEGPVAILQFGKPGGHRQIAGALPPGCTDLLVAGRGLPRVWIELKVGSNQPTDDQLEFMAQMRYVGDEAQTCWSEDEVVALLRRVGYKFRSER